MDFLRFFGEVSNACCYSSYLICGIVIVEALSYASARDITAFVSTMQTEINELRTSHRILPLHHGKMLALWRINQNERKVSTLKECQSFLPVQLQEPIPIAQLDSESLSPKQIGELFEVTEFVLAR